MIEQINQTVEFLRSKGFDTPEVGIILGTGLGALTDHIDIIHEISYDEIPHFPLATIEFHKGKLIYGKLEGKIVIAMNGRFHYYEGYNMNQVVYPVRVMKYLGIKNLLISNAAGSMNLNWKKGELMLIDDHINLQPDNPLRGTQNVNIGPLFVDMLAPYDNTLNNMLIEAAKQLNITLNKGVYVAVSGPNLETRAEYRFLRNIGADAVGMSTVPEVLAANQLSLPVCAVSVLTDECDPDNLKPVNIQDIINTAKEAEKNLIALFKELLQKI